MKGWRRGLGFGCATRSSLRSGRQCRRLGDRRCRLLATRLAVCFLGASGRSGFGNGGRHCRRGCRLGRRLRMPLGRSRGAGGRGRVRGRRCRSAGRNVRLAHRCGRAAGQLGRLRAPRVERGAERPRCRNHEEGQRDQKRPRWPTTVVVVALVGDVAVDVAELEVQLAANGPDRCPIAVAQLRGLVTSPAPSASLPAPFHASSVPTDDPRGTAISSDVHRLPFRIAGLDRRLCRATLPDGPARTTR